MIAALAALAALAARIAAPTTRARGLAPAACALLVLVTASPAAAHTLSDGYLDLAVDGRAVTGRVDLAARDLHDALGLDADRDGRLRWREAEAAAERVRAYVTAHVALTSRAGACPLTAGALAAIDRADGVHVAVALAARCPGPAEPLTVDYRAVFAVDARHTGLVHLRGPGGDAAAIVRAPGAITLASADGTGVGGFVKAGVWHIWIGLDHVCFLLALLLPAVLHRTPRGTGGAWQPRARLAEVVREVLGIVTAFTLAHSITLALAALGWVSLPARLIETTIALSVAAAALNNLVRGVDARWAVAFVLGLVHGFGFSGALAGLGLPGRGLVTALLGFNLGVELGQTAIVAIVVPVAFALRATRLYRGLVIVASLAMAALALHWSYLRAFG
jgi:hypothetical protein